MQPYRRSRPAKRVTIHSVPDETAEPSPVRNRRKSGPVLPTRLAVALVGAGVVIGGVAGGATAALLSSGSTVEAPPVAEPEPVAPRYSEQQVVEAKAKLCAAYGTVRQAVLVTTGRNGEEDPAMIFAIAANARMALFDGGAHLLAKLDETPAAATELSTAVRALAGAYQQLAIDYLAEVPEEEQQNALRAVDDTNAPVFEMCQ